MAVLTNNTPVTVTVGEVPLSAPFFESNKMTPIWNKWLSSVSTWITKSQEIKTGTFKNINDTEIGTYIAVRTGNIIVINGSLNAGIYSNTTIMGIPVTPKVVSLMNVSGGTGIINLDKTLTITSDSTSTILISATYIAVSSSENK